MKKGYDHIIERILGLLDGPGLQVWQNLIKRLIHLPPSWGFTILLSTAFYSESETFLYRLETTCGQVGKKPPGAQWAALGKINIIFVTILSQQISRAWVDGKQTETPLGGVCSSPARDPAQPVCHCMQVGCLRIVSENTCSLDLPRGDFAHGIFRSDPSSIVCGFLGGTVARWANTIMISDNLLILKN